MIQSIIISVGGIVGMMILWVIVQMAWKKVFADHISDEDVLADRRSCKNCGCIQICSRKQKLIEN